MCGGGYSPPPPDPELEKQRAAQAEQIENQKQDALAAKAEDKKRRLQDQVARVTGAQGVRSLISGRRGGSGFGRELLG